MKNFKFLTLAGYKIFVVTIIGNLWICQFIEHNLFKFIGVTDITVAVYVMIVMAFHPHIWHVNQRNQFFYTCDSFSTHSASQDEVVECYKNNENDSYISWGIFVYSIQTVCC
jgi:hypothetical protein